MVGVFFRQPKDNKNKNKPRNLLLLTKITKHNEYLSLMFSTFLLSALFYTHTVLRLSAVRPVTLRVGLRRGLCTLPRTKLTVRARRFAYGPVPVRCRIL